MNSNNDQSSQSTTIQNLNLDGIIDTSSFTSGLTMDHSVSSLANITEASILAALTPANNPVPLHDQSSSNVNMLNIASSIAMNNFLSTFYNQPQLLASNNLLSNTLLMKMILGVNTVTPVVDRSTAPVPASSSNIDILTMLSLQQETQQHSFLQQYAALLRQQQQNNHISPFSMLHMSLKRNLEMRQNERKRSCPADISSLKDLSKKTHANTKNEEKGSVLDAMNRESAEKDTGVPKCEFNNEVESCLDRILKEEIYNIFEEESRPCDEENVDVLPKSCIKETSSGSSSPSELNALSLLDVSESSSSAFKKVSCRSLVGNESELTGNSTGLSISPPNLTSEQSTCSVTSISPLGASPDSEIDTTFPSFPSEVNEPDEQRLATNSKILSGLRQAAVTLVKYPSIWSGMLAMRAIECAVNMHLVTGSKDLAKRCFGAMANSDILAEVRIQQRMRTDGTEIQSIIAEKMKGENSVFICIPVGNDVEDTFKNNEIIKTAFVDYFHRKDSAGVATIQLTRAETFTVHVFPPSDIAKQYVDLVSPDLYEKLRACANFLFIILTTSASATNSDQNNGTTATTSNTTPVPTLTA